MRRVHVTSPIVLLVTTSLAVIIAPSAAAAGQNASASAGSFVDPLGAALPAVTVTLSNAERQAKYVLQSNNAGRVEFVGLPPGDYALEASLPGFQTYRAPISVAAGSAPRTFTMQIGGLEETVTVADGAGSNGAPRQFAAARSNPPCPPPRPGDEAAIGGNLRPPQRIRDAAPQYPSALHDSGRDAVVVVDGIVGLDGFITDLKVHEPAPPAFAASLLDAVRQWQFDSTLLNCVPVEVSITITGRFQGRSR